jgi:hypothetical protein
MKVMSGEQIGLPDISMYHCKVERRAYTQACHDMDAQDMASAGIDYVRAIGTDGKYYFVACDPDNKPRVAARMEAMGGYPSDDGENEYFSSSSNDEIDNKEERQVSSHHSHADCPCMMEEIDEETTQKHGCISVMRIINYFKDLRTRVVAPRLSC